MTNYQTLQDRVAEWQLRNFGRNDESNTWHFVSGISEEVGEFHKATDVEHRLDAIADIGIYSMAFCAHLARHYAVLVDEAKAMRAWPGAHVTCYVGDLNRAVLKRAQGIRGFHDPGRFLEVTWASLRGVTWYTLHWYDAVRPWAPVRRGDEGHLLLLDKVVEQVTRRDWKAHPEDAHIHANQGEGI